MVAGVGFVLMPPFLSPIPFYPPISWHVPEQKTPGADRIVQTVCEPLELERFTGWSSAPVA